MAMTTDHKQHWENVYTTRQANEVSWTQDIPITSLTFIQSFNVPKDAGIIDVGGGDSTLIDFLLEEGYSNLTVLDISDAALERAKQRFGERAANVKWIVCDVTEFSPTETYAVWHDRASFHFLTTPDQISKYLHTARQSVKGYMVIGTFSENGPQRCSGLNIRQYSEDQLTDELTNGFEKIKCITQDHITPFNTIQNFLFCSFKTNSSQ
jgi:2-polyprenyl-3-methyl-5-hydroxy-6-metoxy-1,4-benzoquinol methylase